MDFSRLTSFLDSLQTTGIPGCDCAIFQSGQEIYRHRSGYANLEERIPIAPDSLYRMYSMTKVITCVAALQLYEKGAYLMTDPLSDYLPEYKTMTVKQTLPNGTAEETLCMRPIRIQDLFTMSAGLTYDEQAAPLKQLNKKTGGKFTTREFAAALAKTPLAFEPGSQWHYSYCHDVLGALIEVLSGESFGTYLREHILSPLGMEDTFFQIPPEKAGRLACSYRYDENTKKHTKLPSGNVLQQDQSYESGGAGLVSTVEDYADFSNVLCSGGGGILGKGTIDLMRTNHLDEARMKDFNWIQFSGYGYGLGVRTLIDKAAAGCNGSIGEFGWGGLAGTYTLMDPEKSLVVVYAQQLIPSCERYVHPRMRNIIYACLDT